MAILTALNYQENKGKVMSKLQQVKNFPSSCVKLGKMKFENNNDILVAIASVIKQIARQLGDLNNGDRVSVQIWDSKLYFTLPLINNGIEFAADESYEDCLTLVSTLEYNARYIRLCNQ